MSFQKKVLSFWRLKLIYKVLFFINVILCGLARAAIHLFPLKYLTHYFGAYQKNVILSTCVSDKQRDRACEIGRSVRLASKYTPWDSSCLTQAMVAAFWCRRYRIPYVFYIGIAKTAQVSKGNTMAHAWLTAGAVAMTGGYGLEHHHVVSSYVYFSPRLSCRTDDLMKR